MTKKELVSCNTCNQKPGMDREERIRIVAQYFYGNRTSTVIERDRVAHFLLGYIGDCCVSDDIRSVILRTVRVPNSENVVIVYDQTQEDRYVNVEFPETYAREGADYKERWGEELTMDVSCEIPEIGFRIHTRCFACRMDENGVLQSLEDGDSASFIHYFPLK